MGTICYKNGFNWQGPTFKFHKACLLAIKNGFAGPSTIEIVQEKPRSEIQKRGSNFSGFSMLKGPTFWGF
jgi:hypothetical protein